MQHMSLGEWSYTSDAIHASEFDGAYVNRILDRMERAFEALTLATGGDDLHQYMVTIHSWLCDIVEFGRLVVTAMELCTRRFGPVNASADIGGTYYGPASGAAVIEAGRLLADIAQSMAEEKEYVSLLESLQELKNKFEEEYHGPLWYHLQMRQAKIILLQWLDNEAPRNLRLEEVERKARDVLASQDEVPDENRGRVLWLTVFGIAQSHREVHGDIDNLFMSLRDAPSRLCRGTVDAGGRLNYAYYRYVLPRMVLCRDGRVLFTTSEGQIVTVAEHIRKHGVIAYRLKLASYRYESVQHEPWVRHSLPDWPCNIQRISGEVLGRIGMWLTGRDVDKVSVELSQELSKRMPAIALRNWLIGLLPHNPEWRRLVHQCWDMRTLELARQNGDDPKRILRRLAWDILRSLSHAEIIVTDSSNRPTIAVVGRRLGAGNGTPQESEMSIVWCGSGPVSQTVSGDRGGIALVNDVARLTQQSAAHSAGFLVAVEAYRKHVYSYMSAGNVQWLSASPEWVGLQLGQVAEQDEAERNRDEDFNLLPVVIG